MLVLHTTNYPFPARILCCGVLSRRSFFSGPFRLKQRPVEQQPRSRDPEAGLTTNLPDHPKTRSQSPFYFEAGYAGWAKRPSRPFPPPFFSRPSGSFSDPLSTHDRSHAHVNGHIMRGVTNGDDAMLVSENLIGTNDGVGAWAQRERGYAPLWSRMILHYTAVAAERDEYGGNGTPDPVRYMTEAYERTKETLSQPSQFFGTTTASSALLHFAGENGQEKPLLYVTQLGDCKVLVIRVPGGEVLFRSEEQYHYFDCPRQLGTNSPDTPAENAVLSTVDLQEDDIVLALSDGVTDNMYEEDISECVLSALKAWQERPENQQQGASMAEAMKSVAQAVVLAARKVAENPYAGSPYMEKGVEEGLAIEGGKIDDISAVVATCKRRKG